MKHMKKRVAALLLTLAMVLSLMPMALAADEFPDMPAEDDASYAAVKSAVDNGIMTGENGNLNLEGTILRSTVSKMVVTAFAAKGEADLSGYPDVDADMWYAAWMAKANQMGIMTGTSGKMNPNNTVTLAEVATMLVRALGLSVDKDATVDGVAAWAAPYIKALIDANYITAEDAAAAHEPMTRVAFAEVIYKVSGEGNYAKEENAEITEDVNGNIVITANGVSLKGITVKGDVIIADGVDASSVTLDGVKVEGRVVVRGAGAELTNGTTASATVVAATTGETTVKADTSSDAGEIAVSGTNGQAADKVVLDMAEPNVTVTTATEVAVQNAKGGEVTLAAANASLSVESGTVDNVTLQAPNASLSVESGTVGNVTVADGASGVKVDVAEGATIDKVTTNTDLTITGEGTVTEKEGSGTVTDAAGNEVAGSDEPVEVPTVNAPTPEVDPNAPTNTTHTHSYTGTVAQFDATRHTIQCAGTPAVGTEGEDGYVAAVPCSAVTYKEHNFVEVTAEGANKGKFLCECGAEKPADPTKDVTEPTGDEADCGNHKWVLDSEEENSNPTCEDEGVKHYKCGNTVDVEGTSTPCAATMTETTPATGHNLTSYKTEAPTCSTDGKTYFKCSNDGCTEGADDNVYQTIPATGNHTWVLTPDGEGTVAATCMKGGKALYTCTTCEDTQLQDTPVNSAAHTWGDATAAENGKQHTVACTNKDADQNACTATKTVSCTFTVDVAGDDNAAKPATCTEAGKTATKKCSACDNTSSTVIPATGHAVSSAWTKDENQHWHVCTKCGEVMGEKAGHDWTSEAHVGCSTCGWTKTGGSEDSKTDEELIAACSNKDNHAKILKNVKCSSCPYVGTHEHSYSNGSAGQHGTCSCGTTCTGPVTDGSCSNNCGYSAEQNP